MRDLTKRTTTLLLAVLLAQGCDDEQRPEVAAISGFIEHLTAFEAAIQSAPSEPSGFDLPDGVVLAFCDESGCSDANTQMVTDDLLSQYQGMLERAEAGEDDPDLRWFRDSYMSVTPRLRFFATPLPDDTTSDAAWHGRVVVWDSQSGDWLGAVRVDLDRGQVTRHAYAYFDQQGHQVSGSFRDAEADATSASHLFESLLPRAFKVAATRGRDVSGIDQLARQAPRVLDVTLAQNAVVISGANRGTLAAYSGEGFVELGDDEVTHLWPSGDGFVYRRAGALVGASVRGAALDAQRRGSDVSQPKPSLVRVESGHAEDMSFSSNLAHHEFSAVGERYTVWRRSHEGEEVAELARWVDGDWEPFDLSGLTPGIERVIAVDQSGETFVLLTTGSDGPALHVRRGEVWSAIALPRRPFAELVLESAMVALVAGNEGLLRVDLASSDITQVTRRAVSRLVASPQGAWIAERPGVLDPVDFYRIEGSRAELVRAMRSGALTDLAVGDDGAIVALSDGVILRWTPDGQVSRIPAEGKIPGMTATMDIAMDGHGSIWIASTAGLFVANDEGLHTLSASPVPAVRGSIRKVCILGSGPVLSPTDLRRTEPEQ